MVSVFYSTHKDYAALHADAINLFCTNPRKTKYNTTKINALISANFSAYLTDFRSLLLASPEKLTEIKTYFDSLPSTVQDDVREKFNLIGLYNYFIEGYFRDTMGEPYGSDALASKQSIPICPFCNENPTYHFKYQRKGYRRSYDWDHMYAKEHYPFLAISFYNLIPCCKLCNFLKNSQNKLFLNPHLEFDIDQVYCFYTNPLDSGFLRDASKIRLTIAYYRSSPYRRQIQDTLETVGLQERYRQQKELAMDIINKKRMYNSIYLDTLRDRLNRRHPVLAHDLKLMLFGTQFSSRDYYKRSFSKLTNDLINSDIH
ncbi:hypothetical protein ACX0HA_08750 [Flavobacterium hauense]